MIALRFVAYAMMALGAFSVFLGIVEETFMPVLSGIWAGVMGLVFLAVDRVLGLLEQIKDALAGTAPTEEVAAQLPEGPLKTPEEISARLKKLRESSTLMKG